MSSQHNKPNATHLTRSRPRIVALTVSVLVVMSAGVRVIDLDQPFVGFHPTRQYRSALIARSCYYDATRPPSDSGRLVAAANRAMQPAGEPPIIEWLACHGYQLLEGEHLALARTFSVAFWLFGAIPLYGVARRLGREAAAVIALAIYLFLPYGIIASRAFQPDPLMTCCTLWALLALVRYYEDAHLSSRRLAIAAIGIATAVLVKPMSVFLTVPAAAGLAIARFGALAAVREVKAWGPVALGLTPGLVYYGYGALFGTLARDQMRLRFVPSLLPTAFFWQGLATQATRVFGLAFFVAGVMGTLVAAAGAWRQLLLWLWAGYAAFAVAFTYHMPTHDYYHLPFIALIALAVAALAQRGGIGPRGACAVALLLAAWGSLSAWPRLSSGTMASRVAEYRDIGALAQHTTLAVFLDLEYGYPLMYHGEVSGDAWPNRDDLRAESLAGAVPIDAATRFARDYDYGVTHFIVTDLASLAAQPDLQRLLAERTTPLRLTSTYHVYAFK